MTDHSCTDQQLRPTDADPRAYSITIRYEKIESEWYYAAHCTELPDAHVYERSSCEAYASMLMIIEDLQEHHRDCRLPFPEPLQYRRDEVSAEPCGLNFGCTLLRGHEGPCGWPVTKP